jgi:hypothetical protein
MKKYHCAGDCPVSLLDRDSADFDTPLAVSSRIGKTQLAAHRLAAAQSFHNQLIQRRVTDRLNQENARSRFTQFK